MCFVLALLRHSDLPAFRPSAMRCNVGAKNGTNRVTLGYPIVPLIGSVCFISFQAVAPTIKAVCILDGDGGRICSKYYCADWPSFDKQQAFEKVLFAKTRAARVDGTIMASGSFEYVRLLGSFCPFSSCCLSWCSSRGGAL